MNKYFSFRYITILKNINFSIFQNFKNINIRLFVKFQTLFLRCLNFHKIDAINENYKIVVF